MPYDPRELEWLIYTFPATLFIADPEFLDCVAKTLPASGSNFCAGILSQKDTLSFGTYQISDVELVGDLDC